ncbi:CAP domain-containing protein [Frankia sp. Cppng1_Ct_nod]|uniref:CAP domain-containing protein n=1 Tax=Frankia sp. Cppng1_Ct_nod TaxID=2897162 RepID=UPI001F5F6D61|nr:CAP domain-containing protein [Frankia sp. Cppng1_Ct_nod]
MDRHRKHRRSHRGWFGASLVVLVFVLAAGVLAATAVINRSGPAGDDTSVVAAQALASSTAPVQLAAQSVSDRIIDRGTVGGTVRVQTSVPADGQTWVAYVLRGPGTIVRVVPAAPYEADLDTRSVPDGAYTLNEVVFHASQALRVRTSRMRIINTPAPASSAPARPPAQPTIGPSAVPLSSSQPAPTTAPPSTSPAYPVVTVASKPSASSDAASEVVVLTNAERAKAGCGPLTVDSRLTAAAQAHSADMSTRNYFSHTDLDGQTPFQRMAAAGYQFSIAAENIAAGQQTAAEVVTGWMNSTGHRENILNCSLRQIGVGYATGGSYGTYWTQDFGTP